MTAGPTSTRRDSPPGDPHRDTPQTATPADKTLQQHVIAALRAMLAEVELRAVDATATENGVSVMLEHDNVRCVLIVSRQVPRHTLSPPELQIAQLVADGATNRAIASLLDISLWTVFDAHAPHLREARRVQQGRDGGTVLRPFGCGRDGAVDRGYRSKGSPAARELSRAAMRSSW